MAVTIVATPGSATANSYVTLTDAQTFIDGLIENDDIVAWATSTTDQKNRALFSSAQRIDRERFLGARTNDAQALEWPRSGVKKPYTYSSTYNALYPSNLQPAFYADNEIPKRVKDAQVHLAVYLNNNKDGLDLSGFEDFNEISIGNINVKPRFYGAVGANRIPPIIEQYLTGIRISGPATIAVRRS
tara:strand:- start:8930 stop:9490 length:561 start_codon:yes stop_codon:yes gene_type:complete